MVVESGSGLKVSGCWLVEVLLKSGEEDSDFLRSAQVGDRVGDGVIVPELQQWRQFFPIQLFHPDFDVLRQYKLEECPLLGVEVAADQDPGPGGSFRAGERRKLRMLRASTPVESFWDVVRMVGAALGTPRAGHLRTVVSQGIHGGRRPDIKYTEDGFASLQHLSGRALPDRLS